jgi:hypothetical protein
MLAIFYLFGECETATETHSGQAVSSSESIPWWNGLQLMTTNPSFYSVDAVLL